ncbi:lipase class 3 family protein [Perilla frutescens var. hirtella]|uniref:Lipase class 3 family protein n=1 Tax=Perilla frutescens var. hirtella TaxID=608512 RepID=A0AAD4JN15_PERFH|nr:lipase class 3 family protein [Perilla frutescens var. hirtella]
MKVTWPPPWRIPAKWPWQDGRRERQRRLQEEMVRRKKQLQELCYAVKAETLSDLQEILCCMVLSECVYKRPAAEMLRAVNKFKADFGGHLVSLERVQPCSDHVPHRYLLAEAGDTLFASFIGTKRYKDIMADANIFQGAIFHDIATEDAHRIDAAKIDGQMSNGENNARHIETNLKPTNSTPKPAAHRGFMARAKGIPALELYRLAQKKRRKLVLCGHSLGGAVAVLATLAILRVIAVTSTEKIQVKCITFSQPPVGNAALRDYVNGKGWQNYFKTYCIPEDLVPRILSPAYFHHYNSQNPTGPAMNGISPSVSKYGEGFEKQKTNRLKENEGEQLVLGLGPVQNPFWRLSRLVPIEGLRRQFYNRGNKVEPVETSVTDATATSTIDDLATTPQSLEIEESSDGISLRPLPDKNEDINGGLKNEKSSSNSSNGDKSRWRRIPSLPSYVPFGELYLLGNSSVESLSGSEYLKLTSVRSVIAEVKERFQSHSMKSYRSRFQRIYEEYMNENAFSFLGEQELQFPHLQKWLGISVAGTVELGHIVDTPIIRAATSLVPLGWAGIPSEKNGDPLKVDISGFGLHQCTLIQARVNGKWCSTTVESFPSPPAYSLHHELQPEMQRLRITVGAPLKRPPKHQIYDDTLMPAFLSIDPSAVDLKLKQNKSPEMEENFVHPDGLSNFVVFCTTDFSTVAKEVHVRTRRVRLIGLEGAGKTSLMKAILNQGRTSTTTSLEAFTMDVDFREGIAGGLLYSDSPAVNLQNLNLEASNFRDELWKGIRDLSQKTDLVVLVHNLSHRIPRYGHSNASSPPALALLLDEAKSVGIPWVLAITNKFSVSAHQQKAAINDVLQAYQASPTLTEVVNSCPYVMPSLVGDELSWRAADRVPDRISVGRRLIFAPLNLVRRPFQKKPSVLPVEGVTALCQLVHRVLRNDEEAALQELARDRIFLELARERAAAGKADRDAAAGKSNSLSSATVGASVGAGVGILLAVVMGAASALRKP